MLPAVTSALSKIFNIPSTPEIAFNTTFSARLTVPSFLTSSVLFSNLTLFIFKIPPVSTSNAVLKPDIIPLSASVFEAFALKV